MASLNSLQTWIEKQLKRISALFWCQKRIRLTISLTRKQYAGKQYIQITIAAKGRKCFVIAVKSRSAFSKGVVKRLKKLYESEDLDSDSDSDDFSDTLMCDSDSD